VRDPARLRLVLLVSAPSLYIWDGFVRVAWTDDGRAFTFRRRGRLRLKRWIVLPVPEGSREAAEEALRQVMPAPTPTLYGVNAIDRGKKLIMPGPGTSSRNGG
jgi:hypothetical protein